MPEHHRLEPAAPWIELVVTDDDWDAADPDLLTAMLQPARAHPVLRGVRPRARRPRAWSTAPPTPASARRAARSARASRCAPTTPSTARTAGTTSSWPRCSPTCTPRASTRPSPGPTTSATRCCARCARSAASTAASATAAAAPCTCSGSRPVRSAPTRSSAAASRWPPGSAWAHKHAGTDAVAVTYFGDGAINIGSDARDVQPRRPRGSCRSASSSRTTSTPSRRTSAEVTGRAAAVGARPRLRHPELEGRRHGPARGPPRHAGGARPHARRRRADGRRGRRLPLLPPERPLPRQRVPLPQPRRRRPQWRASRPDRPRPPATWCAAASSAQDDVDADRGPGQGPAWPSSATSSSSPMPDGKPGERRITAGRVARPRLRRRRRARRPVASSTALTLHRRRGRRGTGSTDVKFIDAVAAVMDRRMETDPRIVVLGEDVHRLATAAPTAPPRGSRTRSPTASSAPRSARTPSPASAAGWRWTAGSGPSWSSCTPTSCGSPPTSSSTRSARRGTCSAATGAVPLVLRSKVAMGTGYGSQHSMDPAGIFATSAGWRIVAPSTPFDYVGLMNTALPSTTRSSSSSTSTSTPRPGRVCPTTSTTACPWARRPYAGRAPRSPCSPTSR